MPFSPSILFRPPQSGMLIVLGTSVLGGAAYRWSSSADTSESSLNPHSFTPYTLIHKQSVSPTSAIFTLRNREQSPDPQSLKDIWKRAVWSVQVKQPQLQIARAYTPLPPSPFSSLPATAEERPQDLRLLIRKEHSGEVSTYLHSLPSQSTLELRGPHTECELPHDTKEILFLAGGTGIAPAMQVAYAMRGMARSRMCILWASRRREDCVGGISDEAEALGHRTRQGWWNWLGLETRKQSISLDSSAQLGEKSAIVQELDALKQRNEPHTRGLGVEYFVDEENKFIRASNVARYLSRGSQEDENGKKVIFVSGPDGFIEYWAGKKIWIGGREEQGPLGGVLGNLDIKGWKVVKL